MLLSEKCGHKEKLYLYEPNSFKPLAFVENNQCYFYHLDHLGTPQELTDWEGRVVWSVRYRTYGSVVRKDVDTVENNLRFQSQYWDEETGLHYNRFRYYDPGAGHFVQQDPIGLLGGVNNYQYAANPVGWVDPLGLTSKPGDCPKTEQEDLADVAIVRQFENGYQEGHFMVEVRSNNDSFASHQVFNTDDRSSTTISFDPRSSNSGTHIAEAQFNLPNAKAAIAFQENMTDKELGVYDPLKNSCMSHICDVLQAGGNTKDYRSKEKLGHARFFKKNNITRKENGKSLLSEYDDE
ncbi:RHS repeat domain-containing protein [Ketobacter nezhaii]|uniref:RHS repeat domain-containing protein n=1 Tax=Ketobacter sp. MCCC 1A13808 TaxID=2602738 RepID=UPI00294FF944|nr:RHS repeat-associated core domain-containing protein [Ketobacter sp. MCCC 1A13808]